MNNGEKSQFTKVEKKILWGVAALVLAIMAITGIRIRNASLKQENFELQMPSKEIIGSKDLNLDEQRNEILMRDYKEEGAPDSELDYMPEGIEEVGNEKSIVSTWKVDSGKKDKPKTQTVMPKELPITEEVEIVEEIAEEGISENEEVVITPVMGEGQRIVRPVSGEIIIPYNMEHTVYFKTLDQYKCSSAEVLEADEGEEVLSCSGAIVSDIHESPELGQVVVLDLGGGYRAIYGQLKDLQVSVGQVVEAGQVIGAVAAPTKYYCEEGYNLYFELTKDGTPVNPSDFY